MKSSRSSASLSRGASVGPWVLLFTAPSTLQGSFSGCKYLRILSPGSASFSDVFGGERIEMSRHPFQASNMAATLMKIISQAGGA